MRAVVWALVLVCASCYQLPSKDKFAYATPEEKAAADAVLTEPDAADGADALDAQPAEVATGDSDSADGDAADSDAADSDAAETDADAADAEVGGLPEDAEVSDAEVTTPDAEVTASDAEVMAADAEIAAPDAEVAAVDAEVTAADTEVLAADTEVLAADAEITAPDADVAGSDAEIAATDAEIAEPDVDDGGGSGADASGADGGADETADAADDTATNIDAAADLAAADTGETDTAEPDTYEPDTYEADTYEADTGVADTADLDAGDSPTADAAADDADSPDTGPGDPCPTLNCDDGNACTADSCNGGCVHLANSATCEDGDACTVGETCSAKSCGGGGSVSCSDGNVCTSDGCDVVSGCVHLANSATCEDGDLCTDGDTCQGGTCSPGAAVLCAASDACHDAGTCSGGVCSNPAKANGSACSDGKSCTTESCQGGVCAVTPVNASCSDGNACTDDTCNPSAGDAITGCVFANNTASCSSGNSCTTGGVCSGGVCNPGSGTCGTNATCVGGTGCVCNSGFWGDGATCTCGGIVYSTTIGGVATNVCAYDYPVWGNRPDSPNTYVVNGDGTVSDTQTKLMWQQVTDGNTYTWAAAGTYCDQLTLAGKDDWRLPTVAEGESLVDYTVAAPQTSMVAFPAALTAWYWTSVQHVGNGDGWDTRFNKGESFSHDSATLKETVRCVRATASLAPPPVRFTVNGTGANTTVLDNATGLVWEQSVSATGYGTSAAASLACTSVSIVGITGGWRLPSARELGGILDRTRINPAIDVIAFPNSPTSNFWSATSVPSSILAYFVRFSDGILGSTSSSASRIRCVHDSSCATSCDDSNPCTWDTCIQGTCSHTAVNCDDGKSCTTDACSGGTCSHAAVNASCGDGNACTDDSCNPATGNATTGCVFSNNTGSCTDDGDACTADACTNGSCAHTTITCGTNATCSKTTGCVCNSGFWGDASTCTCGGIVSSTTIGGVATNVCAYDYPVWGNRPDSPNTYVVNGDGTVSDTQTKLMWQQVTDGNTYTWAAAGTYCDGLTLAGKDDWRLPTAAEGASLVDYTVGAPTINGTAFPGVATNASFWTSVDDTYSAGLNKWRVELSMATALAQAHVSLDPQSTRCVRAFGPLQAPPSRFTIAGTSPNATVFDNATGLTWEQSASGNKYTWSASGAAGSVQARCNSLTLNGIASGWRVPTEPELFSIVDRSKYSPAIDATVFPGTVADWYWSATPRHDASGQVWIVRFLAGNGYNYYPSSANYVRCVHD